MILARGCIQWGTMTTMRIGLWTYWWGSFRMCSRRCQREPGKQLDPFSLFPSPPIWYYAVLFFHIGSLNWMDSTSLYLFNQYRSDFLSMGSCFSHSCGFSRHFFRYFFHSSSFLNAISTFFHFFFWAQAYFFWVFYYDCGDLHDYRFIVIRLLHSIR